MASEFTMKWRGTLRRTKPVATTEEVGGWTTAILLALLLLNLGWSISAAGWAEGLGVLQWVLLGGVVVGILMARSRFDGLFPVVHSLVTGTAWVIYWVSTRASENLTAQERVYELATRWYLWLESALSGGVSDDNLIFVLELSILGWWLAFLSGWAVFRDRRPWRAVIPIGLAMVVNTYYAAGLTGFLLFYFLLALLLLVRINLGRYETWWRAADIRYAPDIHFDFMRSGFLFSLLVITIAWLLPSAHDSRWLDRVLQPLERPWENVQEEWQRLFTSLNYQTVAPATGFGRTLTLSGNRNVGDTLIMEVRAEGLDRWYWRGVAYDTYTGRGWVNTDEEEEWLSPVRVPDLPEYRLRKIVTETITIYVPEGGLLFAAPLPAGASVPALAVVSKLPPRGGEMDPYADMPEIQPLDISMMVSREPLRPGDQYVARSLASVADIQSLRQAPEVYPSYITERYLQLPETLPARVRELAEEITAGYDNAYDKAAALEAYLREIRYDDNIPPPPPGVDGVDYFLFDIRAGYCDYYASAMAVMARALGIPARVASGYAQGEWNEELQVYQVRELDAHTWVEIYFPGYGWVEFEPTASQPPIERPERLPEPERALDLSQPEDLFDRGPPQDQQDFLDRDFGEPVNLPTTIRSASRWVGIGFAAVVLFVAMVLGGRRWRVRAQAVRLADQVYDRLLRWANRLGIGLSVSRTPYEQAAAIAARVPEGHPYILHIADAYVREQFSGRPLPPSEQEEILRSWRTLRPTLWKRWLQRWLRWRPTREAEHDQV